MHAALTSSTTGEQPETGPLAAATASETNMGGGSSDVPSVPQSSVDSSAQEAQRLREELQQCQEKFASWKEKAKSGVDHLRGQIIDLTQRLDRSEQRRLTDLRSAEHVQSSLHAQADLAQAHAAAAACLFVEAATAQYASAQRSAVGSTPPAKPSPSSSTSPSPQEAVIKKLQRTIQDQSDRLKETQHALRRSTNEVQQRVDALQQQDEAMAALKRRMEALEMANRSLEEQLMNVPNVEEWRAAQDELDHQLERSRLEYETRESNLVLQHSNEIQALNAAHEQDVREMQRDAEERMLQAVQNALASQAQTQAQAAASAQVSTSPQREAEDSAYMDLLRDYRALESTSTAAVKERDIVLNQQKTLLRELQDLFRAIGSGGIMSSGSSMNGCTGVADTMSVADAVRQIGEQRVRLVALQEDLSHCRREVMQLKRSKPAAPVDGLGAQQTQYVRSVVVQLLCSLNDPTVAKRLLPVLSMLLKFSDDDLKAVTKAMPQWTTHR